MEEPQTISPLVGAQQCGILIDVLDSLCIHHQCKHLWFQQRQTGMLNTEFSGDNSVILQVSVDTYHSSTPFRFPVVPEFTCEKSSSYVAYCHTYTHTFARALVHRVSETSMKAKRAELTLYSTYVESCSTTRTASLMT